MTKNQPEKQQPTQNTAQTTNQNGGKQQSGRDQSVDSNLIYLVRKTYNPTETRIQEGAGNAQKPTVERKTTNGQASEQPHRPNTENKEQR